MFHVDKVTMQEPSPSSSSQVIDSQDQGQDQPSTSHVEDAHNDDQGQHSGQDGDPNDQDDQVIPPRNNEDIKTRRTARIARALKHIDANQDQMESVFHQGRSTRRQLASFSEHHAHISMVEPKKVFEALEDSDCPKALQGLGQSIRRRSLPALFL